jgi:Ca2+/Na+ antiporter
MILADTPNLFESLHAVWTMLMWAAGVVTLFGVIWTIRVGLKGDVQWVKISLIATLICFVIFALLLSMVPSCHHRQDTTHEPD